MKSIYVNEKVPKSIMSPIGFKEMKEYKAYEESGPQLVKYVRGSDVDKLLGVLTHVLSMDKLKEIKDYIAYNLTEIQK